MSLKLRYYTTEKSAFNIADFFYVMNLLKKLKKKEFAQ